MSSSREFDNGPLRSAVERLGDAVVLPATVALKAGILEFATVSLTLAMVPGALGRLLRRAWYRQTLAGCGENLVVQFGGAIRAQRSRIGNNCHIGVYNWFGWVDIGDHFMSGSHVVVLSGRNQHSYERLDVPMRLQGGEQSCVTIGDDVWVGASAVISADVAAHSIVASGAVVQKAFEEYDILGGVPAKRIGSRREAGSPAVGPA